MWKIDKIKVLIVEPDKEPYEQEIEHTLETLQSIVNGVIDIIEIEKNVDLIINDEGKILNLEFNRVIPNDVIAGTFIVAGQKNGETISLTEEQIEKYKKVFLLKSDEGVIAFLRQEVKHSSRTPELNLTGIENLKGFITKD